MSVPMIARGSLAVAAVCVATGSASAGGMDKSRYNLFNPTPDAGLRDMATDRPDKTESPYTVDAGRLQIEMDLVAYTRDRAAGSTSETVDVLPFNLKIGLTSVSDIQVVYGGYSHVRFDRPGATKLTDDGGGDVLIRYKHNLWGNDGGRTALSLMPFVKIPTSSLAGANDDVEGGLIVPLAIDLTDGLGLGLMTEIDLVREDQGSGYAPVFISTAVLSKDLTDKLGLFAEIYGERSADDGAHTIVTIGAGVTYAVTDHLQLDTAVNVGVTEAADDINVFAGMSRRF